MNLLDLLSKLIHPSTNSAQLNLQQSIIDHIPNHYIFWKDKNSVYLGCNAALAHALGLKSSSEIVGKTDFDLPTTKEESEKYRADDKEVMNSKKAKLNIEEPQTLPDGTKRILLTSKVPLFDQKGNVYGVLAIYSDITQQKLNEQNLIEAHHKIEQTSKVKAEFIRNISHDIRTPLSGIQQTMQALSNNKIPEEQISEYAFSAWEASNKLMELFDQIIDVSKKEHFDFEDRVVKFDLYKLLQELRETYEVVAKHKGLELSIENSAQVPQYLLGKNLRLHRVLMNLLGNALKFTEKGSVKLVIEKSQEKGENVVLRFSVIDTGIGIPEDKYETIFEPFTRLTPSFQGQYPGSGLGLHVVKDYVKKMQGEIYLESEPGHGSMFSCVIPFTLPILDNDNDVVETEYSKIIAEKVPKPRFDNRKAKIAIESKLTDKHQVLLVEDDKLAQNMGILILKDVGYQIDLAKSGQEALELTSKNKYDLIYMDVGLGTGIDGIETTRKIRSDNQNPNQATVIIALTAHADEIITKECLEAGMQQVFSKPLTPEKTQQINIILFKPNDLNEKIKIIDFELWKNRLGENKHMLDELFHVLGHDFSKTKAAIVQSYKAHDLPTLKAVSHKMKGSLVYCGLPKLETTIKAIESAAKKGEQQEVDKWYPETITALDETEKAYKEWAKTHPKK